MIDFILEKKFNHSSTIEKDQFIRFLQIFSARLVLEVFGGAGAIWGFSEALTLRTPQTVWFWRPAALSVGGIFFVRWILQIKDYQGDIQDQNTDTKYQKIENGEQLHLKVE